MRLPPARTFTLTILCVCVSLFCNSQPVYLFQKDDSLLKKRCFDQTMEKKKLLLANAPKDNRSDYKEIYESQFKEIGKLWQSSRSVTEAKANAYLQAIVTRMINSNPELKGNDARVVFSRDWWPNASSMGEGTIAINAGLVIYFKNEAELAFVIGHELAHYYLNHTGKQIEKYVQTINSKEYQAELKRLSKTRYGTNQQLDELMKGMAFNSRRHSRSHETEADRHAYTFMKNAGYDPYSIRTCLEMLDKVDDSTTRPPLELQSVLSFAKYPFKSRWVKAETSIFSQVGEDDGAMTKRERDSLKTHPECAKRIEALKGLIDVESGAKFLVDEKMFNQLRTDFLVEMTEQCYRDEKLSRNLYYSLLLLKSGGASAYANYSVARCLNTMYAKQVDHKLGLVIDTEGKENRNDYNLLLRMLGRLKLDEIAALNNEFCNQHKNDAGNGPEFLAEMKKAQQLPK
jgi:predicted SprT family Zn-dependent metalloprotease